MTSLLAQELAIQSPLSGLDNVLEDVKIIVNDEISTEHLKSSWINTDNFAIISYEVNQDGTEEITKDKHCLISPFNCLDEFDKLYYDPLNQTSFNVDLERMVAINVNSYSVAADQSIDGLLRSYVQAKYPNGVWGFYPKKNEDDGQELDFVFTSCRCERRNFWAGQWISSWHLSETSLTGTVKAFVHFHEEGNIQLVTSKSISHNFDTDQEPFSDFIKIIEKAEDSFQIQLSEIYQKLSETTFRRLRRQLPITRQKMDWSKIGVYSLGNELASQKSHK